MAIIQGNELVLAINATEGSEAVFAHASNATLSVTNALIDATTKSSNSWEEMITGRKSFTLSADGLTDLDDVSNETSTQQFSALAIAGSKVFFTFQRAATSTTGDLTGWSGEAYIESFEITAPSDDVATYSVSLKGTGPITEDLVP